MESIRDLSLNTLNVGEHAQVSANYLLVSLNICFEDLILENNYSRMKYNFIRWIVHIIKDIVNLVVDPIIKGLTRD